MLYFSISNKEKNHSRKVGTGCFLSQYFQLINGINNVFLNRLSAFILQTYKYCSFLKSKT